MRLDLLSDPSVSTPTVITAFAEPSRRFADLLDGGMDDRLALTPAAPLTQHSDGVGRAAPEASGDACGWGGDGSSTRPFAVAFDAWGMFGTSEAVAVDAAVIGLPATRFGGAASRALSVVEAVESDGAEQSFPASRRPSQDRSQAAGLESSPEPGARAAPTALDRTGPEPARLVAASYGLLSATGMIDGSAPAGRNAEPAAARTGPSTEAGPAVETPPARPATRSAAPQVRASRTDGGWVISALAPGLDTQGVQEALRRLARLVGREAYDLTSLHLNGRSHLDPPLGPFSGDRLNG